MKRKIISQMAIAATIVISATFTGVGQVQAATASVPPRIDQSAPVARWSLGVRKVYERNKNCTCAHLHQAVYRNGIFHHWIDLGWSHQSVSKNFPRGNPPRGCRP